MRKLISRIWGNILFLETLFLLAFIPLFPKIPLLDVRNTWVYVRLEDFVVVLVFLTMAILLIKRKVTLKTPLTIPIFAFWLVGAISTIHAVVLIFPNLPNVFPNVAFLSLIRHIEYMGVFFIAYLGMKDGGRLKWVVGAIIATLIGVIAYGFGQKFLNFPAFLTMNEEFAKGVPIHLSELSRVPSTFAGHYDLAAYLVLILPIVVSLFFVVKNLVLKAFLLLTSLMGFVLLFMTVSRVSFAVLFASLLIVLFFQKRKLVLLSVPAFIAFGVLLIILQPTLLDRFKGTVSDVEVLVDAKTGNSIGHVKFVSSDFFDDKIVLRRRVRDEKDLSNALRGKEVGTTSAESAIYPKDLIPERSPLVTAVNVSTGESLPSGTGYVNLALSPITQRLPSFFYELPPNLSVEGSSVSAQVLVIQGDFIVKKAEAYDLSFTTRFQGEWPNAVKAFQRNILLGSGYGSVSLAVDNNYLRMLAETGILGLITFMLIFLSVGIYIKKTFADLDPLSKGFVIGFSAGVFGLFLNALLIDVFEASKVAFTLWLLMGVVVSEVSRKEIDLGQEIKKVLLSKYAIFIYLVTFSIVLFSSLIENFFVGDDFTWLRWAADCGANCSVLGKLSSYFLNSDGFFYRPGTKIYFDLMYQAFWLNPGVYHAVSIILHFLVASLLFLLANKIFANKFTSAIASFLFLFASGHLEAVFWISSTGHLFSAAFGILSLLTFIHWDEKGKIYYYAFSLISICLGLLFHELGVVFPLLIVAYEFRDGSFSSIKKLIKRLDFLFLLVPVIIYLGLRFISQSHWLSGDYSYNPILLPFNLIGNLVGYILLTLLGPLSLSITTSLRSLFSSNLLLAAITVPVVLVVLYLLYKTLEKVFSSEEKKVLVFGFLFTVISLLPFLGLGNLTSRYSYLASVGIIIVLVVLGKKIYEYLLFNGRTIAQFMMVILVSIFVLLHVMQLQEYHADWFEAGKKSKNFFFSFDSLYRDYWSEKDIRFHFVGVPIREGHAWIFPVGLSDAVWFAFKSNDARIFLHPSREDLTLSEYTYKDVILIFSSDGTVSQLHFTKEPTN